MTLLVDCQTTCAKSSVATEPKGVRCHATWMKPDPTQLSGPAGHEDARGRGKKEKTVISYKGNC